MTGKYRRGLETEKKILRQFALNKEVHQYNLNKEIGVSYRTTLRVLHSLEELGELRIVRKEQSEKQGKERNVWAINLEGLLDLLMLDEESWKQIDLIAEAHQDKLLIFKKWRFFQREDLTPLITRGLNRALQSIARGQLSLMVSFQSRMNFTEEKLRKVIDSMTLGCYALRDLKNFKDNNLYSEILKVLRACKKDEELHNFVTSELSLFKEIAQEDLHWIGEAQKLFASL